MNDNNNDIITHVMYPRGYSVQFLNIPLLFCCVSGFCEIKLDELVVPYQAIEVD